MHTRTDYRTLIPDLAARLVALEPGDPRNLLAAGVLMQAIEEYTQIPFIPAEEARCNACGDTLVTAANDFEMAGWCERCQHWGDPIPPVVDPLTCVACDRPITGRFFDRAGGPRCAECVEATEENR